ncbi:SEL1-like repeat protein [Oscillospiraceae bacterium N12]|jgi:TPR repeat protein|uniref:SEL1-like repeat protein n=1 Tax=Jilunia laotingensis TaxID=2763675 RepID=A0A926EY23_9BACT|nr:SEL1-like repeat protein [Jilunia laotingensis]MBC8592023.1 SEL1-like repeat protein [Jilunia laotingensis]
METVKDLYEKLLKLVKASGKPAEEWFKQYNHDILMIPEKWWESLAVCEYALDNLADKRKTAEFFRLIFSAYDCNVEVDLNEEDYAFWWEKVQETCDRVAEFDGVGWSQKGSQYAEARYGVRNINLLLPYYEKAAEMGDTEAQATVAYWHYIGYLCKEDHEEAERLFEQITSPEGLLWKKFYRACMESISGNPDKAMTLRQELLQELPEGAKMRANIYAAIGDDLNYDNTKITEQATWYEKALQVVPNFYVQKHLAILYFRYPELGKKPEDALRLWEGAWHAGVWSAANFLGYNYQDDPWTNYPKAIEWLEKGMLYCESYSAYELALIYLYNENYQNIERGLYCLQRCVEDGYAQGIVSLAMVYFNGELVEKNVERSHELLLKASELGSGEAAYRIGWMYENSIFTEAPDYQKAFEYFEKAAEREDTSGLCRAALYLANGYAGVTDPVKSKEYYEKAAEQNAPYALVELGFLQENEQSYQQAFELFKKAAVQEYPYGMFRVGYYLSEGILGDAQPEEGAKWYTKAAEAGDSDAMFFLGKCYKVGYGIEENPDKALEWFQKGAEENEPRCITELGLAYENGIGVEENPHKAVEFMKRAADMNYSYAQFKMGDYYFYGYGPCMEDNKQAVEWYEKAEANNNPLAMLRLGDYYLYDYDKLNESEKAIDYYQKAAKQEYYNEGIGICYEMGIGVEENETEAFRYYTLAADGGNTMGMYRTALCYYNGVGVKQNLQEAFRWFNDAAGRENIHSYYYMGKMLMYGEGCTPDPEIAVQWLKKAADLNSDKAQFELGNAYLTGTGVDENDDMAMEWFEKAAENGNEKALKITGRRKR